MIQASDLLEKYSFLLQPIKDLTKNFEVDISKILDEYITELEKTEFSLEDGKTLNFAEAAMLIQGSACVWGRKVEYLHKLVGETLTMLANKKSNAGKNSEETTGDANENEEDHLFEEDDVKFLSLNDDKSCNNNRIPKSNDVTLHPLPEIATLALEIENCNRGTTLERASENDNIYHVQDFVTVCSTPYHGHVSGLNLETHGGALHSLIGTPLHVLKENATQQMTYEVPPPQQPTVVDTIDDDLCDEPCDISDAGMEIDNISEHTVEVQGMNLRTREGKISPVPPDEDVPPVIELLDEHVAITTGEYSSSRFRMSKPIIRKQKRKEVPFLQFLFDSRSHTPKNLPDDILRIVSLIVENSRHESKIMELRRHIRKENKQKNKTEEFIEDDHPIPSGQAVVDDIMDDYSDNNDDYDMGDINEAIQQNQHQEESEEAATAMTYEELVHVNVRRFYEEAVRFKQDNLLLKRVKEWEKRVVPLLKEQNSRPEFDIHECGDKMVSQFHDAGETIRFTDCASRICEHEWEICRMFAATLQLANDGNFLISKTDEVNSMTLELLTNKRSRERLAQYDEPLQG